MKIHVQTPEVYDYLYQKFSLMQAMINTLKFKLNYTEKTVQPPELIKQHTEPLRATITRLENIIIGLKNDMLNNDDGEEEFTPEEVLEYYYGIKPPHKKNDNQK